MAVQNHSHRDYEEIRQQLLRQKQSLLAEAQASIGEGLNPQNSNLPDVSDQASVEVDRSFLVRLREREQKLLKKIDQALERIEQGTFGICEACGEEIAYERLKARPVTTLCITCKIQQEEEEERYGVG